MMDDAPVVTYPIDCVWVGEQPDRPYAIGECFWFGYDLSKHYRDNIEALRRPISVVVPDANNPRGGCTSFCIDSHPTHDESGEWTVTIVGELVVGERPDITVTPSIHCVGIWHGFLTHGQLSGGPG